MIDLVDIQGYAIALRPDSEKPMYGTGTHPVDCSHDKVCNDRKVTGKPGPNVRQRAICAKCSCVLERKKKTVGWDGWYPLNSNGKRSL